jgi:hypothetical protein
LHLEHDLFAFGRDCRRHQHGCDAAREGLADDEAVALD